MISGSLGEKASRGNVTSQNIEEGNECGALNATILMVIESKSYLNADLSVGRAFGFRKSIFDDLRGSDADLGRLADATVRTPTDWSEGLKRERETILAHCPFWSTYSSGQSYWTSSHLSTRFPRMQMVSVTPKEIIKGNDLYFMAQISITYLIGHSGDRGKFS